MAREQLNSAAYSWNGFAERQELAAALAGHVAGRLTKAIAERGTGLLAVSGGTTPAKFFVALSAIPIAWDKVIVTLVDDHDQVWCSRRTRRCHVATGRRSRDRCDDGRRRRCLSLVLG